MQGKLFKAAIEGNSSIVLQLLKDEVNATVRTKAGNQALIYAAWKGHTDVVHLLCDLGVNVNYQAPVTKKTPLMFAARWGHNEVVKLLLASGADLDLVDNEGGESD